MKLELTYNEELCERKLAMGTRLNPVAIWEITDVLGVQASSARIIISSLRDKGVRVCSDANGYWIAQSDADYIEFRKTYLRKVLTRINRIKAMDSACKGQMDWSEVFNG